MAGESWKSHKNTALERDMSADHDAQMDQWLDDEQLGPGPAEVARSNAADLDRWNAGLAHDGRVPAPGVSMTPMQERALRMRGRTAAEMAGMPGEVAARHIAGELSWAQAQTARDAALRVGDPAPSQDGDGYEEDLRVAQQPAVAYVPPPVDPRYRQDADYPSVVVANTRVVPAETVDPWAARPAAETARFQTELAIAQQVAGNQVRAQQQADAEAADRSASAAIGQYIAPTSAAPARTPRR